MRFGIVAIPTVPEADGLFERAIGFAARVEALGFAGLWTTDSFARGSATCDPLLFLSALCQTTERIELGTCVMQVPLRHPVEQAHRAQTLNLLSRGRFRFGVGSGSTRHDFDAVQVDYERRFTLLPDNLAVMRKVWTGRTGPRTRPFRVARHGRWPAGLSRRLAKPSLDQPRGQALPRLDRIRDIRVP